MRIVMRVASCSALAAAIAVSAAHPGTSRAGLAGQSSQQRRPWVAYVLLRVTNRLTAVSTTTDRVLWSVQAGHGVASIAISPDGRSAFVATSHDSIIPVNLVTHRAGRPVDVGFWPQQIAYAPDGKTLYAVVEETNAAPSSVVAISTASDSVIRRFPAVGWIQLFVSRNSRMAYLVDDAAGTLTPLDTVANTESAALTISPCGTDLLAPAVFSPGGQWLYVATWPGILPVEAATATAGRLIKAGACLGSLLTTSTRLYATDVGASSPRISTANTVARIDTLTGRVSGRTAVGKWPAAMALTGDGKTLWVANTYSDSVTPVSTSTGRAGRAIRLGMRAGSIRLAGRSGMAYITGWNYLEPGKQALAVLNTAAGKVARHISPGGPLRAYLTPDARQIYLLSAGELMAIWASTGQIRGLFALDGSPAALAFAREPR